MANRRCRRWRVTHFAHVGSPILMGTGDFLCYCKLVQNKEGKQGQYYVCAESLRLETQGLTKHQCWGNTGASTRLYTCISTRWMLCNLWCWRRRFSKRNDKHSISNVLFYTLLIRTILGMHRSAINWESQQSTPGRSGHNRVARPATTAHCAVELFPYLAETISL